MEDSGVINFSTLKREFQNALEADKRYQRENEAKFRALHQNVGSYEEFRNIVLASHLKPLSREDKAGAPCKQPWNSVCSSTKQQDREICEEMEPKSAEFQPRTALEFQRDWHRLGQNIMQKYSLLISLGGVGLKRLFSVEIGFGLLGEVILVLDKGLCPEDTDAVVAILEGLSQTCRFGLNLSLMSQAERDGCVQLFCRLLDGVDGLSMDSHAGVYKSNCLGSTQLGSKANPHSPAQNCATAQGETVMEKCRRLMPLYGIRIDCSR